jgi:hypothetical protein
MLLVLSGCYSWVSGPSLDFNLDGPHLYVDSIEIESSLSDTVVQTYLPQVFDAWYDDPVYFPQTKDSVYLTVRIKNISGRALRFGAQSAISTSWGFSPRVTLTGGREGDSTPISRCVAYTTILLPSPSEYTPVSSGAVRVVADSVALLTRVRYPLDKPGRYWLHVTYQNYMTGKSRIPYWTGAVSSDTLWFTIAE